MYKKLETLLNFLHKNRFLICFIIFILCIIFEISGSSIGAWADIIKSNTKTSDGMFAFVSRHVRADEWATYTSMMFSQKYNHFNIISSIMRGGHTNIFFIYGLPTKSIFQLYRPFQLGFLFLGNAKGLSFFWIGRILALFLVSIEFFMIITKNRKDLSYLGAFLITLSPIINWWFAVNGIVELFVFGELAIVLLYKYIKNNVFWKRLVYLFFMIICAGGYIMVLYPAWQIPLMYVFLILALWVIIDNRKDIKISFKDIISIIIAIGIFSLSIYIIFTTSMDVIKIIMHTDYPGARFELGGNQISKYISYILDPLLPYYASPPGTNHSEAALMFGLFPIGIILSIINLIKVKKKDLLTSLLLIVYMFFSIWCIFGFPKALAKISMLYISPAHRSFIVIGLLDIIILIRTLSINSKIFNKRIISVLISILLTGLFMYGINAIYPKYLNTIIMILMTGMLFTLFLFVFNIDNKKIKYLFIIEIFMVLIVSSFTINPIRSGTGVIYKSKILKKIKQIDNKDSGIWITEGMNYPATNYIINVGVSNINGTNVYPNLKLWKKIDKNSSYKVIYNRYAHIRINLYDNNQVIEKFRLLSPDVFEVNINEDDLKKLKVKYIFTSNDFDNKSSLNKIYHYKKYNVYKVVN